MLDEDVKATLIIVGAIFVAAAAFDFIVLPYQNCMQDAASVDALWCA